MKNMKTIFACLSLYFVGTIANVCETNHTNNCGSLVESNYFDSSCYSSNNTPSYGDLGCNAGGLLCCRFCEFGLYENITCINQPPVPPLMPAPPSPPPPPHSPRPCNTVPSRLCDRLVESNYFDNTCYAHDDIYGGLGCNAGGLKCCRFCGFGHYENISCFPSPPAPPRNPLIMPVEDIFIPPKKSKIQFNIRIRSDVETFKKKRFKRKLRMVFDEKIPSKDIMLRVRPGSLIIDVTLLANSSIAENTSNIITHMTPIVLGNALNESVMEVSAPVIVNNEIDESEDVINYLAFPMFMLSMSITICSLICLCCYYNKIKKLTVKTRNISINIKKKKRDDMQKLNGVSATSKLTYKTGKIAIDNDDIDDIFKSSQIV